MYNYIIEDDIDFYKEIYQKSESINQNNKCLINNEILSDTSLKLPCGHKFNYYPLYREIYEQKYNSNCLELYKLKTWQMKCPYCRKIFDNILPYNPAIPDIKKIRGVNSPSKYSFYPNKCKYVWKSGNKIGKSCNKECINEFCSSHNKYNKIPETQKCISIFKYGKNIGKQCECKIYKNDLCKRHWNINNKNKV